MTKIGRNDPCWCGSGKKYKKCHEGSEEDKKYHDLVPVLGEFGARNQALSDSGEIDIEREVKIATKIIEEKRTGNRKKPSQYLSIESADLSDNEIKVLLDLVGHTCDQFFPLGRSTACIYSAILLRNALRELYGKNVQALVGKAKYYDDKGNQKFEWGHGWLEYDNQIVDGNIDSLSENPKAPDDIRPKNYWGVKSSTPKDRKFEKTQIIDDEWIKANMTPSEVDELSSNLIDTLKQIPDMTKLISK